METAHRSRASRFGIALACFVAGSFVWLGAGQAPPASVAIDPDDIGGVVTSEKGPEAGVWVIAETKDLPTKFVKIVVTDDQGRYLMPDLPQGATYDMWVRGYGLVDSTPVKSPPGRVLNLAAKIASTPQQAALIYPADYWMSLIRVPAASEFPGTGDQGNGISTRLRAQDQYVDALKSCILCHQVGNRATREMSAPFAHLPTAAGWDQRVQAGQRGSQMSPRLNQLGRKRALTILADWTDRIKAGEVPPAPPRPQGVERNVVITMWDWATGLGYIHDSIATDKRHPTVNADGRIYGVDDGGADRIVWVDPVKNTSGEIKVPRNPSLPCYFPCAPPKYPSAYWGMELPYQGYAGVHTPGMDEQGRVWFSTTQRTAQNPPRCYDGSNKFSAYYPMKQSGNDKVVGLYDPRTGDTTIIDTCFGTHHMEFVENEKAENTVWFSNPDDGFAIGWIDTRTFDATKDALKSQGWCPAVLDTNGDGRITKPWTEPEDPFDPTKDRRHDVECYGIGVDPTDGSAWCAPAKYPGFIVNLNRGSNPPESCKGEAFHAPASAKAFTNRGINVDRDGVVWTNYSGSGQIASFDRRKCKIRNGPKATGEHCPEGWSIYQVPSPKLAGTDIPTDWSYQQWVDQYDIFGLGKNIPITNGTNADSLMVFLPEKKQWVVLRVPYPLGFHSRLLDGRIDNPAAGWKGRALWSQYASAAVFHSEGELHEGLPGGRSALSKAVKFQLRPNPLAK